MQLFRPRADRASEIHREKDKGAVQSARGIINADVNAAYNIIRKAIPPEAFADGIAGVGLHPDGLMMKSHKALFDPKCIT